MADVFLLFTLEANRSSYPMRSISKAWVSLEYSPMRLLLVFIEKSVSAVSHERISRLQYMSFGTCSCECAGFEAMRSF